MVRADEATRFKPGQSAIQTAGPKAQGTSRMVNPTGSATSGEISWHGSPHLKPA
jgi:hypothetical protein